MWGRQEGLSAQDEPVSPRQVLATSPLLIHLLHIEACSEPFFSFIIWALTGYRMAVICVKSRAVLWSTAHDKPLHSSVPWGKLATLNHTTIAYITQCQLRPMLCVRDALTSEIKATKPILRAFSRFHRPKGFQSNSTPAETLCISLSLERFPPPDNYRELRWEIECCGTFFRGRGALP